jgi:hypothetical protein
MKTKRLTTNFFFFFALLSNTVVSSQDLPDKFYGRYVSNVCDACHWTFHEDGMGEWRLGLRSGNEQVPFIWEALIDKNGDLQLAKQGNDTGYAVKITYMTVPLSENVKSTLITSQRDNPQAMGIFWFNEQKIIFQFLAKTNGFYSKI